MRSRVMVLAVGGALALIGPPAASADSPVALCVPSAADTAIRTPLADGTCSAGTTKRSLAQQSDLTQAKARISALEALLAGVTRTSSPKPMLTFSGVNVQIVDGLGATDKSNGTGNLIIGYNETPGSQVGSHNLLLGTHQAATSWGSIVAGELNSSRSANQLLAGYRNTATGRRATVTGGAGNLASSFASSVSGGCGNVAGAASTSSQTAACTTAGAFQSVSGGQLNRARTYGASVSGGCANEAGTTAPTGDDSNPCGNGLSGGLLSWVGGGLGNQAGADYATASGGQFNQATGAVASISAGAGNVASGPGASVSGGNGNRSSGFYGSVGGGSFNVAGANFAAILGGTLNHADDVMATVVGGCSNDAGTAGLLFEACGQSGLQTVVGGVHNNAAGAWSAVGGGERNITGGLGGSIAGGRNNFIDPVARFGSVLGGCENQIERTGTSSICQQYTDHAYETISGGLDNFGFGYATSVAGGGQNLANGTGVSILGGFNVQLSGSYAHSP